MKQNNNEHGTRSNTPFGVDDVLFSYMKKEFESTRIYKFNAKPGNTITLRVKTKLTLMSLLEVKNMICGA